MNLVHEKNMDLVRKQNKRRKAKNHPYRLMKTGARISSFLPTQALIFQVNLTNSRLGEVKLSPLARGRQQRTHRRQGGYEIYTCMYNFVSVN